MRRAASYGGERLKFFSAFRYAPGRQAAGSRANAARRSSRAGGGGTADGRIYAGRRGEALRKLRRVKGALLYSRASAEITFRSVNSAAER